MMWRRLFLYVNGRLVLDSISMAAQQNQKVTYGVIRLGSRAGSPLYNTSRPTVHFQTSWAHYALLSTVPL